MLFFVLNANYIYVYVRFVDLGTSLRILYLDTEFTLEKVQKASTIKVCDFFSHGL